METLRVAIVGHGLIGSQRSGALHALSETLPVRVAATIDPAGRDPRLYGGAPHASALSEVDPESFDAAVIALPHDLAAAAALEVLAAGKAILVEKPLGVSAGEAARIAAAAERVERPSFVGYNYRFLPHVIDLDEAIAAGRLGKLRSVDMLIGHGGHPGSADGWKLIPEHAGGGVLLDPGVHLLDLLLRIDARLEQTSILATSGFWGTGIEEDLVALFAHDALLATLRVSHIRWVNTFRIEVVGEDGYGILDGRGGNYGPMRSRFGRRWGWKDDAAGRSQRETEMVHDHGTVNRSLEDELEAVVRRWLGVDPGSGPRPATIDDGRRITELADSMYARLRSNRDRS